MFKYEKIDDLDRSLCKKYYKELSDSLFNPTKHPNLKLDKLYANSLFRLECFVDDLLSNEETPIVANFSSNGRKNYTYTSLVHDYLSSMPNFIDVVKVLSPRYEYSERINAFIACSHAMGLLSEDLDWGNILVDPHKVDPQFGGVSRAELFNTLVKAIRSDWKLKNRQAKVNARKREASERHEDYCDYADALFDDCARQVILRFDLCYKTNSISLSDMQKDLTHLFENQRGNSLFDFMNGYIVKLEYGVDRGPHIHVIVFLDGSERKNSSHIHFTKEMGEYWINTITEGRGDYRNVNDNADQYEKLGRRGIGVINWYETELRNNLKTHVIGYLCKVDQFIRPKWGPKVRLFRRGLYPEIRTNKVGRPRKALESYAERQFPLKFMSINPCDLEPKVL